MHFINNTFCNFLTIQNSTGDDDDGEEGSSVLAKKSDDKLVITPKWPTRVFAMECIRMILAACKNHPHHVDLAVARKLKATNNSGN